MLHRFLFVAGMTVGVMTPLVWMAYVARPASHGVQAPVIESAKTVESVGSMPDMLKPAPVPHPVAPKGVATKQAPIKQAATKMATSDDTTASIPPAPAKLTPAKRAIAATQPKPSAPHASAHPGRTDSQLATLTPLRRMTRAREDSEIPAVVDRYDGAHIITVCAALTVDEQLRAGCF